MFPPALASVLRERCGPSPACLAEISDQSLVQLLTTVFFAGLETYEGEHNPIRVAFLGSNLFNFIIPEASSFGATVLYQWKLMPFQSPRPFDIAELVKLAVAGVNARIYSAVNLLDDGTLAITGLAREGFNGDADPYFKVVAPKPGCLSIRSGRHLLLGYERGAILTGGEHVVSSAGPIRRALEAIAGDAGLDIDDVPDYLDAIQSIVREMAAHGRGGILIISCEDAPHVVESATYRMTLDSSVTSLLRLARRISRTNPNPPPPVRPRKQRGSRPREAAGTESVSFGHLLRNAFVTEADRVIEELGALTGIDGAVLLNRELALISFGVILPVRQDASVAEALDGEGHQRRRIDFGTRGTRHRASATYAADHPRCVVFVASEDGHVSCLFRDPSYEEVLLWRLGPADVHIA